MGFLFKKIKSKRGQKPCLALGEPISAVFDALCNQMLGISISQGELILVKPKAEVVAYFLRK